MVLDETLRDPFPLRLQFLTSGGPAGLPLPEAFFFFFLKVRNHSPGMVVLQPLHKALHAQSHVVSVSLGFQGCLGPDNTPVGQQGGL